MEKKGDLVGSVYLLFQSPDTRGQGWMTQIIDVRGVSTNCMVVERNMRSDRLYQIRRHRQEFADLQDVVYFQLIRSIPKFPIPLSSQSPYPLVSHTRGEADLAGHREGWPPTAPTRNRRALACFEHLSLPSRRPPHRGR
jgi:hypothetical protein